MTDKEAIKIILDAILSLQINSLIKEDILQKLIKENREKKHTYSIFCFNSAVNFSMS